MSVLENLQPQRVFHYFEEITKIPHGSGNTKEMSDYLVNFAKEHGLRYIQDESNNVILFKPAAKGYENAPTVMLQGHMDMVCEKTPDSSHDFTKDALKLQVEGDFISAQGTTLGGDDGIAVAYGLALLEDETLEHPALEVVITVDEEIGLLGATALNAEPLQAKYLINLDSEEEGYLWAGCAGGMTAVSELPVRYQEETNERWKVTVSGLAGGHSGAEIDKNRGNATLVLARFLKEAKEQGAYAISELNGGLKDNAIPRTAQALILAGKEEGTAIAAYAKVFTEALQKEYTGSDEGIYVTVEAQGIGTEPVLHPVSQEKVLFFLMQYPNGIQKMCGFMEGLVETSCNLGITKLTPKALVGSASVRSSVGSAKKALADKIAYLTEFLGGDFQIEGEYPSWEYKQDSTLRPLMVEVFREMYHREPEVKVIHAGLECGLFYEKIPGLDCVSLGPNMQDIHTTEEKLSISSVERVWEYLLEVLKKIK
ncbi:MAG: aminoacyl-histidine dipeptidase [Blautia sp.]|uniref:aminoacyl-histidine dipeptidase n=1 Tax=Blautia sp. TaxID=1955243 RepID=UPI002E7709AF|nr:aminoacyl-histidine dipeptidase [Blautia sp.]MEE1443136.1 aminoacyl-histidine dipeptidase [Blautia sp.]